MSPQLLTVNVAMENLMRQLDIGMESIKVSGSNIKKNGDPLFIRKKIGYLILEGSLDFRTTNYFKDVAVKYKPLNGDGLLVLDLRGLTYIDSCGVGSLVDMQKILKTEQKSLKIVNLRGEVKRVLDIACLSDFLGVSN